MCSFRVLHGILVVVVVIIIINFRLSARFNGTEPTDEMKYAQGKVGAKSEYGIKVKR